MKKIFLAFSILILLFGLTGCFNFNAQSKAEKAAQQAKISGRPESGKVVDLTALNGQTVNVSLGDVLYIKLMGEANKGYQWKVTSPVTGDYLWLKDHKTVGLTDPKAPDGKFTDEWWLKAENPGTFDLQFEYGLVGKTPTQTFKVQVISVGTIEQK
ncbi:MAG: protease inhibitor I42 family protein [Candidatus Buchananbacteria bacterium]